MKHFNEYFSFDQFMKVVNATIEKRKEKETNYNPNIETPYDLIRHNNLLVPIHNFLQDYNKEYGLLPIENGVGHSVNLSYFWDNFRENNINKKGYTKEENIKFDSRELGQLLSKELFFPFYINEKDIISEEFWQERYTTLANQLNEGNFEHFRLPDSCYCFECGANFKLELKNWQPQLLEMVLVHEDQDWWKNKYEYNPAPECAVPHIVNLEVEFPSGNLLVTDWFRMEEFTNTVDLKGAFDDKYDVNCALGRIEQSTHYAKDFNFISTPGGGMPNIFKNGNSIIVGNYDEEDNSSEVKKFKKSYKKSGRVDCMLRAVTIIDSDQLIKILSINSDTDTATQLLDSYMKKNKDEIKKLTVTPGTYIFEFSGDHYNLKNHTEEKFPESIIPFVIVQEKEEYLKAHSLEASNKPVSKKVKMK